LFKQAFQNRQRHIEAKKFSQLEFFSETLIQKTNFEVEFLSYTVSWQWGSLFPLLKWSSIQIRVCKISPKQNKFGQTIMEAKK
jgi:hypothetical protein